MKPAAQIERLKRRIEILEAALGLIHDRAYRISDFTYAVRQDKADALNAIREWLADDTAAFKARGKRFKANCRRYVKSRSA